MMGDNCNILSGKDDDSDDNSYETPPETLNTESETGEPGKEVFDEMNWNRGRQVWRGCQIPGRRYQQHQEV